MIKKEFVKLFKDLDDNAEVVIPSTTQFKGFNVITEKIEIFEDKINGKNVIVIQEVDRLI